MAKNKKPKIACITTVRTSSSRLPNKPLLVIRGKRVIDHVIERMKSAEEPDLVILCTSDLPEDDILAQVAEEHSIQCFRGSAEDRLMRMLKAAESFDLDYVVTFDADDPFCGPELVDMAIRQVKKLPCDVIKLPDGLVCGGFTFCISTDTLKEACRMKDTNETEMYEVYILDKKKFKVRDLEVKDKVYFSDTARLTLDYPEDLKFFETVFDDLSIDKNIMPLKAIMHHLEAKPELASINFVRHKDYIAKREKMRLKKKLKK